MAKERERIPAKPREQVLKEFNHRCAKCGADRPHLHHIDEDPSNNDPMNLIQLCPNCHLTDQHDPTRLIEPGRLRLFRRHRDPTILTPQFQPLFKRMRFLDEIDLECDEIVQEANTCLFRALELFSFVSSLEMGAFYGSELGQMLARSYSTRWVPGTKVRLVFFGEHDPSWAKEYCEQVYSLREPVYELIVELLRYQDW